jgi:predicted nucleic acid-binding Zn ribbon protein
MVTAGAVTPADSQAVSVSSQSSDTLRPAAMTGVVQPRSQPGSVTLVCLVCGAPFTATRRDRRACSSRCARTDRAARRRAREAAEGCTCVGCGGLFFGGRSDRRHCDARCRMRAYRRRQRERVARPDGAQ